MSVTFRKNIKTGSDRPVNLLLLIPSKKQYLKQDIQVKPGRRPLFKKGMEAAQLND
jgi:hypothetical protein